MPYNRLQGLRGLKGLSGLSAQEKEAWYRDNADLLPNRDSTKVSSFEKIADRVYRNQLFAQEFKGKDDVPYDQLTQLDSKDRDSLYKNTIVKRNFDNAFKSDKDYGILSSQLDTQGMLDLLNSNYMGTVERQRRLSGGLKSAKDVQKDYDTSLSNPFVDVIGAGYMEIGKTSAGLQPFEQDDKYNKSDKEIREKLFSQTQKRRENEISSISNSLYADIVNQDKVGIKSLG